MQDPLVGTVVDGKYQVVERIGAGGMGTVYKVIHVSLGAPRALKVMRRELLGDPALVERFRSEARLAEGLRHPSLVALYDFGQLPQRGFYLVSEFVEGATLAVLLRRRGRQFPSADVVRLVGQITDGLALAHRRGVVHRDISPENVMLTASEEGGTAAKLLDFGIAKATLAGPAGPTGVGWNMGKVGFSSPEQIGMLPEGEAIDARCDVFSLAAVAYAMLAGRLPWRKEGVQAYTHDLLLRPEEEYLAEIRAHVPEPWARLFERALARRRDERVPGMAALKQALAEAAEETQKLGLAEPTPFTADQLRASGRDAGDPFATRSLGSGPSSGLPALGPLAQEPTHATSPPTLPSGPPTPPPGTPAPPGVISEAPRASGPVLVPSDALRRDLDAMQWESEPAAAPEPGPGRSRPTVLLLDDDGALRSVLPLLLGAGIDVLAASWDPQERADVESRARPELILADPGEEEDRARARIEWIRRWGAAPIVLFSAADTWTLREQSRRLGLDGYLSKEKVALDLGASVRRLLDARRPDVPRAS